MSLFTPSNPGMNLLPFDGEVYYQNALMDRQQADYFLLSFMKGIEWRHDEGTMFGKKYVTKRKVAWYGDRPFDYNYSSTNKRAMPWTKDLKELKKLVESSTGETYNSCLLNLYHNGEEAMGWHSDNESELKPNGAIASMSFGAERKFVFKHRKTTEKVELPLEHGSLLTMKGTVQSHWLHRLPPTKKISSPRVNLTFRTIVK